MSEAVCTKNHIRVWSKLTSLEWQLLGREADVGGNFVPLLGGKSGPKIDTRGVRVDQSSVSHEKLKSRLAVWRFAEETVIP